MLMITAANMDMIFTELFNFLQHVKGPTHEKGHTLDLVFSLGLNIDQLCVKDSHVIDHSWTLWCLTIVYKVRMFLMVLWTDLT